MLIRPPLTDTPCPYRSPDGHTCDLAAGHAGACRGWDEARRGEVSWKPSGPRRRAMASRREVAQSAVRADLTAAIGVLTDLWEEMLDAEGCPTPAGGTVDPLGAVVTIALMLLLERLRRSLVVTPAGEEVDGE